MGTVRRMAGKSNFILSELDILAWNASVQRANIYAKCEKRDERRVATFRDDVTRKVADYASRYSSAVSEAQHCENIALLAEYAAAKGGDLLTDGRYRYGVAQKLLNLTLKYHWCLGHINEPPHCPVDRIVINLTRLKDKVNWTQIAEVETYMRVIGAIREEADRKGVSIAQWELECYDRRGSTSWTSAG
jgi:hypothetical protein